MEANKPVVWAPKALRQLWALEEYIAQDKPIAAQRFTDSVFEFVEGLSVSHSSHEKCRFPKLRAAEYYCLPFRKEYIIIYCVSNVVEVVAIMHARRSPQAFDDLLGG